jgi:hypothetical protein
MQRPEGDATARQGLVDRRDAERQGPRRHIVAMAAFDPGDTLPQPGDDSRLGDRPRP